MNRHLYNNHSLVETAIYRVFVMIYRIFVISNFHQKTLTEPYCLEMVIFPVEGTNAESERCLRQALPTHSKTN
jgi:hypothetical protein